MQTRNREEQRVEKSTLYQSIVARGEASGMIKGEIKVYTCEVVTILTRWLGVVEPGLVERIKVETDRPTLGAWREEALYLSDTDGARRLAEKIQQAPLP